MLTLIYGGIVSPSMPRGRAIVNFAVDLWLICQYTVDYT